MSTDLRHLSRHPLLLGSLQRSQVRHLRERGAALLAAMLTVTLVATLASGAMWQQWRSIEIESAERARAQNAWVLNGALDWARLILSEDGRTVGPDDLSEPWAVPLAEARLSTFLAAADKTASTDNDDPASETFLSGSITDLQSRLNITNLVEGGIVNKTSLQSFSRLFVTLGLPAAELTALSENLRQALDASVEINTAAPLLPQRLPELVWLGLSPATIEILKPYIALLPTRTTVNLNTASAEVIYAAVADLDMARAQRLVNERERTPFKLVSDASRLISGVTLDDKVVSINTRFFEVSGRLRTPRGVVEEQSLIQRDGRDVRILRRERVVPVVRNNEEDVSTTFGNTRSR